MTEYSKPDSNATNKVWASTAPIESVVEPNDTYINRGWEQVKPPSEYFNWWMRKVDTLLAYANQKGVPQWDSVTSYFSGRSFVQHNGRIWLATEDSYAKEPNDNSSGWRDYLKGIATQYYTDNAVNTLRSSLHKVATTGLASDLQGYLPWGQLSDIPQWIRETHTDNGQLYMRSPDGTQYRLGNGRLDFFDGDSLVFSVNRSGEIEKGTISSGKVVGLGDASHWGVQEEIDIWKQEYGTGKLAREATMAVMRDWVESFKNTLRSASTHEASDFDSAGSANSVLNELNKLEQSLASIAKSGKITDSTGNLPLSRVDGVGPAATFNVNTTNTISYDYGKIPSEGTVKAQLDNLGGAARWGVQENWGYENAQYGTGLLAREGAIAALRDALRSTTSTLGFRLAKYRGRGSIGEGGTVAGGDLLPASAEFSFDGSPLVGQWKAMGVCRGSDTNIHGQQTTLWVRVA